MHPHIFHYQIIRRGRRATALLSFGLFSFLSVALGSDDAPFALEKMRYTTKAYQRAALSSLLNEVNRTIYELKLPDKYPLETKDILETVVASPFQSLHAGHFGCIQSTSYTYCASVENKLSYIEKVYTNGEEGRRTDLEALKRNYLLPIGQIDTNCAFRMAMDWLDRLGVDVTALNRHCLTSITAWRIGNKFVPLFRICWRRPNVKRSEALPYDTVMNTVATVELFTPTHLLRVLRVEDGQYLLRHSLQVTNTDDLLLETDDPKAKEMWFITRDYKRVALDVMLRRVNGVAQKLGIFEHLPLEPTDLTEADIETPFFSDHQGRFATISTKEYFYAAILDNKLSYINQNSKSAANQKYLPSSPEPWQSEPSNGANATLVRNLAMKWLSAFSVNVSALDQKCQFFIESSISRNGSKLEMISWTTTTEETTAVVEMVLTEHHLIKLWIQNPAYLTSERLIVPKREELLIK
jgi:hypothetical protein